MSDVTCPNCALPLPASVKSGPSHAVLRCEGCSALLLWSKGRIVRTATPGAPPAEKKPPAWPAASAETPAFPTPLVPAEEEAFSHISTSKSEPPLGVLMPETPPPPRKSRGEVTGPLPLPPPPKAPAKSKQPAKPTKIEEVLMREAAELPALTPEPLPEQDVVPPPREPRTPAPPPPAPVEATPPAAESPSAAYSEPEPPALLSIAPPVPVDVTKRVPRVLLLLGGGALLLGGVAVVLLSIGRPRPPQSTPVAPPASAAPAAVPTPPTEAAPAVEPSTAMPTRPEAGIRSAANEPVRAPARPRHLLGGKKVVLEYDTKAARPETPPPTVPAGEDPHVVEQARESYHRGNNRLFAGDSQGAIAAYKEALKIYPGYVAGYRGLGLAYAEQGKTQEALTALRTYVRTVPMAKDVPLLHHRIETLEKR